MFKPKQTIIVIGGGVVGLTTAYRLLEAGYMVTILARSLPPHTTSDVAAAYWSPSALFGETRVQRWALDSLEMFRQLLTIPESGIDLLDFYSLSDQPHALPNLGDVGAVEPVQPGEFPGQWHGYQTVVPRIDVPSYMPWLYGRVEAMGGIIRPRIVQHFAEINSGSATIVNCTGLGARLLTGDQVFPIRGQVMTVRRPADFPDQIISADSDEGTTYIIARRHDCLLGGTYQYYDGDDTVDPAIGVAILERCARFHPALAEADLIQHKVGLRPGRSAVRLESEQLRGGQLVIHNYGHGSIGHTLAWGCAAEVVRMVQASTA